MIAPYDRARLIAQSVYAAPVGAPQQDVVNVVVLTPPSEVGI